MIRRNGIIPPLTDADHAAGVRMHNTNTGVKLSFSKPEVADLHRNVPNNFCPKCGKRFSLGCQCVIDPTELDNKPHQGRPWAPKVIQKLPDDHPDSPNNPNRHST